jgi:hypothetical protein
MQMNITHIGYVDGVLVGDVDVSAERRSDPSHFRIDKFPIPATPMAHNYSFRDGGYLWLWVCSSLWLQW